MSRRIFNHFIRGETTADIYPDKIDILTFKNVIVDNFSAFETNMEKLGVGPDFIEEWAERYLAWLEIEEER